jgi:hypothetical protein
VSTATLTKPEATTREDGVSGYAVTLLDTAETSQREPVHIITNFCNHGEMTLGVDRVVTLKARSLTNRVVVFSERDTEMITYEVHMPHGGTVVIYPVGHGPDTPKVN